MFQFSIYIRHCASSESAQVHVKRVKSILPPLGQVGILTITDKQFASMELFTEKKEIDPPIEYVQLELFWMVPFGRIQNMVDKKQKIQLHDWIFFVL